MVTKQDLLQFSKYSRQSTIIFFLIFNFIIFVYYISPAHVSAGTAIIRRVQSVLRNLLVVLPDTVTVPFQNADSALLYLLN